VDIWHRVRLETTANGNGIREGTLSVNGLYDRSLMKHKFMETASPTAALSEDGVSSLSSIFNREPRNPPGRCSTGSPEKTTMAKLTEGQKKGISECNSIRAPSSDTTFGGKFYRLER